MSRTLVSSYASAISLSNTADNPVTLIAAATITDAGGYAALSAAGGLNRSWTISNAGVILEQTKGAGILLGSSLLNVTSATITNDGTISGGVGIRIFNTADSTVTNAAGGTIVGTASHGLEFYGIGSVTNAGTISATTPTATSIGVYLRSGGVIVNDAGGVISGGDGVVLGADGTLINRGTIAGLASDGWAVLFNYNGGDQLVVDQGAAFAGNINGGSGTLELASGAGAGTLAGFDGASIANFSTLRFDDGAQWTVAGTYSANGLGGIRIENFATGDVIDVTDFIATHAAFSTDGLILTNAYNQHTTLHIQGKFTLDDFQIGHVPGQSLITLGTSAPFGIISGSTAAGVTLSTHGVSVTGTIEVSDGPAIYGDGGAYNSWTIVNSGTISSGKGGAVALGSGTSNVGYGVLTNEAGGVISGGTVGIYIYGPGSVTNLNTGTITGTATTGIRITGTVGTVANFGLLNGGQDGVVEASGGSVTNAFGGTIAGGENAGIVVTGGRGTVVNGGVVYGQMVGVSLGVGGVLTNLAGGTISGDLGVSFGSTGTFANAGVVIGTGDAVSLYGGSTLINSGTIAAGSSSKYAVLFHDGDLTSRLIVQPGAVFNGKVAGDGGVIELAPTTGRLAGFGTSIVNFSSVVFDPTAQWLISGDRSDAGLGTIAIAGFAAGDTIDLTDFAATSETFSNNELILTDGKGAHVTLHIQGTVTGPNFHLAPDTGSGSLVTKVDGPFTFHWTGGNGDWSIPGNWDNNFIPGSLDTAIIDQVGANTVTIAQMESVSVANVTINRAQDTLQVSGQLAASGLLTISAGGFGLSNTGVVSGGTIVDNTGDAFSFSNGIFSGVTVEGPFNITANNSLLRIENGLTATGLGGKGPGVINVIENGVLDFLGSQTIDNAAINLNSVATFSPSAAIEIGGGSNKVLTLGPSLTLSSTAANTHASISDDSGQDQNLAVNKGTIIAAAAGGSFDISTVNGFSNEGTILISNGDLLQITRGFGIISNSGMISVTGVGSTLELSDNASVTPSVNNTVTINLGTGTTLELNGFYTVPSLGTLMNDGATTQLNGTFDGENGTLALGTGTMLNSVLLANQIRNATIIPNDALTIVPGNASLQNVVYEGPLAILVDSTQLTISQKVSVTDTTGKLPGTITVAGQADGLTFANDGVTAPSFAGQTLDDVTLNIGNKTSADVMQANFFLGTFTVGGNAAIISSTVGAQATIAAGLGTVVDLDGLISATGSGGTLTLAGVSSLAPGLSSTLHNDGTIVVANGDTLRLTTAIASDANTGTIDLGSGGMLDVGGSFGVIASVAANQTLMFTDATGTLTLHQPDSFAASIAGFRAGDVIDLAGISADSAIWTAGTPGHLAISNNGTPITTLSVLGDYSGIEFTATSDQAGGSLITGTCYAEGTRILTPGGEVPIERLREGDLVVTVSGRTQPICWIGRRHVDFRGKANRQRIMPIGIAAHAFGHDRPRRELILSPDHAVFVDDVLVPIMHLANGRTVAPIDAEAITYYHLELPRHDVLIADGLPAESYLEAGARDVLAGIDRMINFHSYVSQQSDHYAVLWELNGYAPLLLTGNKLDRIRWNLSRQASLLAVTDTVMPRPAALTVIPQPAGFIGH